MSKNIKDNNYSEDLEKVPDTEVVQEAVVEKEKVVKGIVNCPLLNVRKLPDKKALIVSVLHSGDEVRILDQGKDGWYKISIAAEYKGHVMSKFVDKK